jgi:Fe-S-cluster containining protein
MASGGDAVIFPVELHTAGGAVRGRLAVQTGPMRLAELVPLALEITELLVARAGEREAREGRPVSCRAGCGACCRQMIPLSPPEVFFLGDFLASLAPARRSALGARFDGVVRTLGEAGLLERLLAEDRSDDEALALAAAYFRLGQACPFLTEDESCGIHAQRPVGCREYNVTSPAAWCADPFSRPIARVPMPQPLSAALAQLSAELGGIRPLLVPLALAPIWASQNAGLNARTWPGPELFGRFMRRLGPPEEAGSRGLDESPGDGS